MYFSVLKYNTNDKNNDLLTEKMYTKNVNVLAVHNIHNINLLILSTKKK